MHAMSVDHGTIVDATDNGYLASLVKGNAWQVIDGNNVSGGGLHLLAANLLTTRYLQDLGWHTGCQ